MPQISDKVNQISPPAFVSKTYDMVDYPSIDVIVSWSEINNSFFIWKSPELARDILPRFFKHNQLCSFSRQLNSFGYRKVDHDRFEYAHRFSKRSKTLIGDNQKGKTCPSAEEATATSRTEFIGWQRMCQSGDFP
ncbi:hypothetical protein MKX01_009778 [Papaver californicum]|nr:hypothetical protein MKX01_009778 [Papaver californicum]